MLFLASQTISDGTTAGLRSTAGVCLGYVGHSIVAALGVAAIIAASPVLFEALRWFGVVYLIYLAFQLVRSATRTASLTLSTEPSRKQLRRGLITAFLNPKGIMIYFAILSQFMDHAKPVGVQALVLSSILVALCGIVYTMLSVVIASIGKKSPRSERQRRWVQGTAGCLLIVAAGRLAAN